MTISTTVTTEAPPATRVRWCKVCLRFTAHVYIGTQEFPGKRFWLYNCSHCQDTATVKP